MLSERLPLLPVSRTIKPTLACLFALPLATRDLHSGASNPVVVENEADYVVASMLCPCCGTFRLPMWTCPACGIDNVTDAGDDADLAGRLARTGRAPASTSIKPKRPRPSIGNGTQQQEFVHVQGGSSRALLVGHLWFLFTGAPWLCPS